MTQAARICFDNDWFYDENGKFNEEKAKDAVIALMDYHGCPLFPNTRESMWITDCGKGRFSELGLAACFHCNNDQDRYMMLDFYLLPGQMLPEHWHEATDRNPAKMEGWLIRYGLSHIVGEGPPNLGADCLVPACHMNGSVTVRHEVVAMPGMFTGLNRVGEHHWQYAGPEGAIITEVANVHDGDGLRWADPAIQSHFNPKKD